MTTITVGQMPIDFGASGRAEILQNVNMIASTIQGTVPLDRSFGIDSRAVDRSPDVAKALFAASVIMAITEREPRVIVEQVTFEPQEDPDKLVPVIRLQFVDESEAST
ncbi:hypothetical protein SAMN05216312_102208 [Cohnella sp. OV330]|uniref:GPW/gp25 family protein n=1 Tax=Cohnella sp. OV330 TaxID=1855288 RepID=UPI0008EFE847|nr:GPW/gp25 family protein [Cohnella sp. OV330]SFA91442.1 hypothetical protein SAMN05216312_102208 [Cohnella sp. OV330]